ncbi:ABC transporter permease [Acidihalobacter ferrooxydans]|uniref:Inner-membrane translocator n=1 Tax=Acidihalobacter ferrooxydans TaxID=1765967 RepID=A0A1P8UCW7_9GAMM|nr:ABC transporter permease [Acidihalobacter ferrooxydans]APZ41701.1 inner-membrane translocator [Acidihalobacter ferrooxydans]
MGIHTKTSDVDKLVGLQRVKHVVINNGVLIGFIVLVVGLSLTTPYFLTTANLFSILVQSAPYVLLAIGELVVVLVAGIDLSVGAMAGLSGAVAATLMARLGLPWPLALLGALIATSGVGALQGAVVNYLRVTDFIATLAGLSIFSSLTLIITQGNPISINADGFNALGQARLLGVPAQVWIAVCVIVGAWFWLAKTASGQHIYAVGGNRIAAYRSGIAVRQLRTAAYAFSGLCSGIAGIVFAAQLGSADPNAGRGDELTAIAAVVIGGVSLFGGRGTVWGAVMGALLIATILDALVLLNVPPYYTQLVQGFVILLAVMLDYLKRRDHAV